MIPRSKIDKHDQKYTSIHRYISLLRGINVSGKNMITMPELVALYEAIGFTNVVSYIQTGNVIFESPNFDTATLEKQIEKAIADQFDLGVPVIIRTKEAFQQLANRNPFLGQPNIAIKNLYVTFLSAPPSKDTIEVLQGMTFENEAWEMSGLEIFAQYSTGYGTAKFNNNFIEKKLGVQATTRNWKSVISLHHILGE